MTDDMLEKGIVQEASGSAWCANVIIVPKKNGKLRYAVNYTALNKCTVDLAWDLPLCQDVLDSMGGSTVFTTLDLAAGYWQIPISQEDRAKAAFVSPDGRVVEPTVIQFGLANAPSHFSRYMAMVLGSRPACKGRCVKLAPEATETACMCARRQLNHRCLQSFIDDCILYSTDAATHVRDIKDTLDRLCGDYGLSLRGSKCVFARAEVEVLGHRVSAHGIRPCAKKVQAISETPFPVDKTAMKSFLGLASYYRKFIKSFAAIAQPLNALLKKDAPYPQSPSSMQLKAFTTLRSAGRPYVET